MNRTKGTRMQTRFWPFILLGLIAGGVAAILTALDEPFWVIFASVLTIIVVFFLLQEAMRDPVEAGDVETVNDVTKPLPTGFGRALLEQLPLPLLVISDRGRVVYGNRAAKEILPRLVIGEHFASLFRAPAFVDAVNAAINEGVSSRVTFTSGQSDVRFLESRIALLPSGSEFGDSLQAIVQIEDRTHDRRGEKMRTDFIANASHELRTPLASILGYIETMQGHAKNDPVAQGEFLKIMAKQATRMQRLVDDLMSLSRIELREHLKPEDACGLNELVLEVVSALLPLEKKYDVKLECDLPKDGPEVVADRDQLNQVLVNLIDNAMKYSGGGKPVRVFTAPKNLRYPDMVGITISDEGAGIDPKHLDRLTERFYRVNATQSRNKGGTGLGLAIVKHIVNRHSGELQIESTLGEGSQFTVWLPET